VWGETFTNGEILGNKTDSAHRIRMTVNGEEADTYEDTILHDRDQIVIYYEAI
jgi:hypothetical protein